MPDISDQSAFVRGCLEDDTLRMRLLGRVRDLALPDCWIAAGFVRACVWDRLHGRDASPLASDVDVVWFDPSRCAPEFDRELEMRLRALEPDIAWEVKNQARMHKHNGDAPYASTRDALCHWAETATAIAARLDESGRVELLAPFGCDDLLSMTIRPTPAFVGEKRHVVERRCRDKRWLEQWPRAVLAAP